MKRIISILFCLTLFLFVSCGIPYVYLVSTSDYSITSNTSTNTAKISLKNDLPNLKYEGNSPEVYLYYLVKPTENTSYYSSLVSSFNTYYSAETGSPNLSTAPFYKEYNKTEYGIFPIHTDSLRTPINKDLLVENAWNLKLDYDATEGFLYIIVNDDATNRIKCSRYFESNRSFLNDGSDSSSYIGREIPDSLAATLITKSFIIEIYAVLSLDIGGMYDNIYNSPAKLIYSFEV